MKIPDGYTESQVTDIIEKVVGRLAYKFVFGYHDVDDIKSLGRILAIEGMKKFDGKRPLENFLYIHVKNRLGNEKRNKYERKTPPCLKCPFFDKSYPNECAAYSDKMECEKWAKFRLKNDAKKNLMRPGRIEDSSEELNFSCTTDVLESMSNVEILELIDKEISSKIRPLFIKFRNGIKLVKAEYKKLLEEIKNICQKNNLLNENEENSH